MLWYLAFPFTLANVAGFMEPQSPRGWFVFRLGVALSSVCLTISMAAWLSVIAETASYGWVFGRIVGDHPAALAKSVLVGAIGPLIMLVALLYRQFRSEEPKRGNAAVAWVTLAALFGLGGFCVFHAVWQAIWHRNALAVPVDVLPGHWDGTLDPMTVIVVVSSGVVMIVAISMAVCSGASRLTLVRDDVYWFKSRAWHQKQGASVAAAALFLVLAIALLHTAGSALRLTVAWLMQDRGAAQSAPHVLLQRLDESQQALRIDLIPIFSLLFLTLVVGGFFIAFWNSEKLGSAQKHGHTSYKTEPEFEPPTKWHYVVDDLAGFLAWLALSVLVVTSVCWIGIAWFLLCADDPVIAELRSVVQVSSAVVVAFLVIGRPEFLAKHVRQVFNKIADIAGFWPPSLQPLAGVPYLNALVDGIRTTLDEEPDPARIALMGHSQGSVVCAWFVAGAFWENEKVAAHRAPQDRELAS